MDIPLDEVIYFDVITSHPTTGAVSDADSTPTFAVYEESTDTDIGVGGNLTKRTSLTGDYRGSFTASAANGFEVGKWYNVIASGTVNSIAGKAVAMRFRIVAAEAIAGKQKVDVDALLGTAWLTPAVAGTPDVNAKQHGGTAQTGRDIGASVLLSSGTGIGQISLSSGKVAVPDDQKVDVNTIKTQSVTAAAGITMLASVGTSVTSTAQTGDSFARLGAPSGASHAADVAAVPAGVWGYGSRTLTAFGSLVSDVAAAVWAYVTRTLTAFAFDVEATVDTEEIAAETAAQVVASLQGVEITLTSSILNAGVITIQQGDDYDADIGTAITWNFTGLASFVGGSAVFTGGGLDDKACEIVSATQIRMELTAAESAELDRTKGVVYKLEITFAGGKKRTPNGTLIVNNQYGRFDDPE